MLRNNGKWTDNKCKLVQKYTKEFVEYVNSIDLRASNITNKGVKQEAIVNKCEGKKGQLCRCIHDPMHCIRMQLLLLLL